VTLELRINAEGRVVSAEAVRATSPAFEEAAKKVALLLKFKPAMVGRNKVAVKLRQTIQFELKDF
jgi:TonB family protein